MALTLPNAKVKVTATTEGTAQTAYTATSNQQKISSIRAANIDGTSSADINVFIANGGTNYYLSKDTPVPAGSALNLIGGDAVNVGTGDVIKVFASAASDIDLIISFAEIS